MTDAELAAIEARVKKTDWRPVTCPEFRHWNSDPDTEDLRCGNCSSVREEHTPENSETEHERQKRTDAELRALCAEVRSLRAQLEEVEARYTREEALGALETAFERGMDPGEFAALLAQIHAKRGSK